MTKFPQPWDFLLVDVVLTAVTLIGLSPEILMILTSLGYC